MKNYIYLFGLLTFSFCLSAFDASTLPEDNSGIVALRSVEGQFSYSGRSDLQCDRVTRGAILGLFPNNQNNIWWPSRDKNRPGQHLINRSGGVITQFFFPEQED